MHAIDPHLAREELHNDDGTKDALHAELDRLFPDAKSKEIVEHEGRRYQRRFYPLTRSIPAVRYSKWEGTWEDLGAVA